MIRFTRCLSISVFMLLAAPAVLAQHTGNYLNPYATDVKKAIAPLPGDAPRPGLTQNNSESPACRELRIRMDRTRSMPHSEPRAIYPDGGRRNGQSSAGAIGMPASDPLADAEHRYRAECN